MRTKLIKIGIFLGIMAGLFFLGRYLFFLHYPALVQYTYNKDYLIVPPDGGHALPGSPDFFEVLKTGAFAFKKEEEKPKVVALTFDDGPFPLYTPLLLDVLKRHGIKATFFVNGIYAERFPQIIEDIYLDGHEVGNHTYSHKHISSLSPEELDVELGKTEAALKKIAGRETKLMRPPGGQISKDSCKLVADRGYTIVMYSINPGDWWQSDPNKLYDYVFSHTHREGIILLHTGLMHTVELMPTLIDEYQKRGYRFVTISELAEMEGIILPEREK
ncbi:MAG: polysaccharide deacetylase family protein [Firmicutes bacterium]|nr:polysaccharide deacetylase family protein [Bacillota bacterium]